MHKFLCLSMAATLGLGIALSVGAPYELAAQHLAINKSPAAEVVKTDANQAVMQAALDRPELPAGMAIVLPESGGGLRRIA